MRNFGLEITRLVFKTLIASSRFKGGAILIGPRTHRESPYQRFVLRVRRGRGPFGLGCWAARYRGAMGVVVGKAKALIDLIQEFLGKYVFVFFG